MNKILELIMMILQLIMQKNGGGDQAAAGQDPLQALSDQVGMDPNQLTQMLAADPVQALSALSQMTGVDLSMALGAMGPSGS